LQICALSSFVHETTAPRGRVSTPRPDRRPPHFSRPAAVGLGVAGDHRLEESRLDPDEALDRPVGDGIGREFDKTAEMTRLERRPHLAGGLEAADAGAARRFPEALSVMRTDWPPAASSCAAARAGAMRKTAWRAVHAEARPHAAPSLERRA
jgi:hypothetical protein